MTKENQKQEKKLLDLPCNFIKSINMIDSKVFKKVYNFFSKEYIQLSYHQDFEDNDCRAEWVENLSYLETFTFAFKGYSKKEIDQAFTIAFNVLNQNRANVLQEMEVSNV